MREVNFSIPNVNKASVGITTALYDRRALDCTSTLPLINSLNHLAYLTTSSARIRDILTIDGGVERLVCILKQGRSPDMMEMWKWNLAFQCVVNIGVRGSESVRTRVVEADMVPVIATILNNYIMAVDQCREKAEAENSGRKKTHSSSQACPNQHNNRQRKMSNKQSTHHRDHSNSHQPVSRRRDPPLAIEIPQFASGNDSGREPVHAERGSDSTADDAASVTPISHDLSPMDHDATPRTHPQAGQFSATHHSRHQHHRHHQHHHLHHHHHRSQDIRGNVPGNATLSSRHISMQSLPHTVPSMDVSDGVVLPTVRDVDRLPSTVPPLQAGIISQPDSPTTPSAPSIQSILESNTMRQQPSVIQQQGSADSDDTNADEAGSENSMPNETTVEPMIDIQTAMDFQEREDQDAILDDVSVAATLQTASEGREAETFNITHQSANDGSIINTTVTPTANTLGLPATLDLNQRPPPGVDLLAPPLQATEDASQLLDRTAPAAVIAATPRDEDVLMSLQLLAYVSKYCNLRSYFQMSHLVPKLQVKEGLNHSGDRSSDADCQETRKDEDEDAREDEKEEVDEEEEVDQEEEYLRPDDFNIFPLVEKFTVRHHSQDMQHWAGVVMRNLCRKDDARGGIRQCAYYECGRWEQFTRQFAKCRRCRRTKYCSKECQKNAWVFHRHWCSQVGA